MAVCIDVKALGPLSQMIHSLSWDRINHKVTDSLNILFYLFLFDGYLQRRSGVGYVNKQFPSEMALRIDVKAPWSDFANY